MLRYQCNVNLKQISKYKLYQIELNHRIKNNFQHLVSMLSIDIYENSKQYDFFDVIKKIESKIYTMSTIHNDLCEKNDFSKLNFQNLQHTSKRLEASKSKPVENMDLSREGYLQQQA